MDVALAADGSGVAELLRDRFDRRDDVLLALRLRIDRLHRPQRGRGQDGPGPGAEVLGREVAAGDLAEVIVHVAGADVARLAVVAYVREQLFAGQVLAAFDDPRQP